MSLTQENIAMEREYRHMESTQARYTGRRKFACCHQCGSTDGMQAVHRENITQMDPHDINRNCWYRETGNSEYVFHRCWNCNRAGIIPDSFGLMTLWEVLDWRDADPMQPDYAALAAEPEAATAGQDSRESAGLEG